MNYNMNIQIYDCAKKTNSKYSNSNCFLKDLSTKLNTPVSNLKNLATDNDNNFDRIRLIDTSSRKKYRSKLNSIKKSNKLMKSIKTLKPLHQTKTQNLIRSVKFLNINSKIQKIINDNTHHRIIGSKTNRRKNSTSTVNNTINYISITNNNTIALSERKENLNSSKIKGNHNVINIHSPIICVKKYENIFDKFLEFLNNSFAKNKFIEIKKKFIQILFEEFNLKTEFYSNKTEEEILNCSIKNFIKHDYNFYTNYYNSSTRNIKSLLSNEFSGRQNQNNYTNIENFNDNNNNAFLDCNNYMKSNLFKTISNTNRKNDVKNSPLINFVRKPIDKKIIYNNNTNNTKIEKKFLFQNYRAPNKQCFRSKALINSTKKILDNLTFRSKNTKNNKTKNNNMTKHNISNDITFKKEETNKIQEKISKLENGDAYKNSEETNTALLIKIKRGLDDTLKNMFNFSYENFLNKDSENESKKSYLDI